VSAFFPSFRVFCGGCEAGWEERERRKSNKNVTPPPLLSLEIQKKKKFLRARKIVLKGRERKERERHTVRKRKYRKYIDF